MKLLKIMGREEINIEKLLIPSNSGLRGANPDPFKALGIEVRDADIYFDKALGVEVRKKRGEDIPGICDLYTKMGIAAFGVTGDDLLDEYKLRNPGTKLRLINTEDWIVETEGARQKYSRPTLALIGLEGVVMGDFPKVARVVVNAKYSATARAWLSEVSEEYGIEFRIRELNGKTETEIPELADFVIDVVFSGNTLRYTDEKKTIERSPRLAVVQPIRQSDISVITSWQTPEQRYVSNLREQYASIQQKWLDGASEGPEQLVHDLREATSLLAAAADMRNSVAFAGLLHESAGRLPMAAAVTLGMSFDDYLAAMSPSRLVEAGKR